MLARFLARVGAEARSEKYAREWLGPSSVLAEQGGAIGLPASGGTPPAPIVAPGANPEAMPRGVRWHEYGSLPPAGLTGARLCESLNVEGVRVQSLEEPPHPPATGEDPGRSATYQPPFAAETVLGRRP